MTEMNDARIQLPEGVPPLTSFYIYLTAGCNLACRHCWITPNFAKGELRSDQYLSVELLEIAIAEAKPLGLVSTKLTGGEPTLHPDFVRIVDLLTREGLSCNLETNGTLIDAKLARHLKEKTSCWFISVSLDAATAQTHDAFRNVPGAFASAINGIKHLVTAGYRPQIIMSPHHGNIAEVEELIDLAVSLGAGSVKFNPVTRSGRGTAMHENGEALDYEEILTFSKYISTVLQKKCPVPLIIGIAPALSTLRQLAQSVGQHCSVRHNLGILGSGEMALCGIGRNVPELCFGRLGRDSLREIWFSNPVLQQLRKDLDGPYPDICGECIHARTCLMHCVAQNYLDHGKLASPSAICLDAMARGLFPDSRRINTIRPASLDQ
jgi:SynChlorMet cassette radical SAM/SPASM protein ScmF